MTPARKSLSGKLCFAAMMSVVLLAVGLILLIAGLSAFFFGHFVGIDAFFIFFVVAALVGAVFTTLGGLYLRLWIQIAQIRSGRLHGKG
ncbi:MAG TPA: hypothetical protein VN619_03985 [Lacisediminihabitans sp.]|nr:hypothetical protein [Lacisediminihabitans sp.]HXD61069.1 hypothetical protein [Lacisediminihabitans sp.]